MLIAALAGGAVLVCLAGVCLGPIQVPLGTVWQAVVYPLAGEVDAVDRQIVWSLRVPRVLLGLLVGAGLSIAGTAIQAVVRNPLGDPYLIGIVPGATLGAVLVIVFGTSATGGAPLSVAAFLGGLLAFVITFAISRQGAQWPATRLVLSGVAVGYMFTSAAFFLQVLATPNDIQRVLFWSLGSVAGAHWADLGIPAAVIVVVSGWLLVQGRRLNALAMGQETAGSLGIDVGRFQLQLMVGVALLTGTIVAVAGGIGFVGLIIPHVARLLVGAEHRRVLITSLLLGGTFLVTVDIIARIALPPVELPLGVITSAVGSPFLLWLLRTNARRGAAG